MKTRLLTHFLFILAVLAVPACAETPRDIAQRFAPPALLSGSGLPAGMKPGRLQLACVLTSFGQASAGGTSYVVAAYSSAHQAAIRVLRNDGTQWSLADERSIDALAGSPAVELRDLDGDGVPEVVVTYNIAGSARTSTWLFRWSGTSLISLWDAPGDSDSQAHPQGADVADYVDFDGDGQLEIVTRGIVHDSRDLTDDDDAPPPDQVQLSCYRLTDAYYQAWKNLIAYKSFVTNKTTHSATFDATDTSGQYLLRIIRSGFSQSWSIANATVELNGVVLTTDAMFQQQAAITIPVGLQAHNQLRVTNITVTGSESTKGAAVRDIPRLVIDIEPQ